MIADWRKALASYRYPCDFSSYCDRREHPGHFTMRIDGDRESTIAFEDRFRELAPISLGAYAEVIFWKMYSQGGRADHRTSVAVANMRKHGESPAVIWDKVCGFVRSPSRENLKRMRSAIGVTSGMLPTALTFPAFAEPERFPMLDTRVAKWVNQHWRAANRETNAQLVPFKLNSTSVRDNDFDSYLHWVRWCREMASRLSCSTGRHWRARDVEMAVFASTR